MKYVPPNPMHVFHTTRMNERAQFICGHGKFLALLC
ncbi:hypothetical protein OKW43_007056 [Paraburkholderia sp. WC7.3g]